MKQLLALAGALVVGGSLGVLLASCGSEDASSPGATAPTAQTRSDPYPYSSPIKAEGSSPPELAGDGRYFGYITSATADPPTISFDVAQFFFGKSVQQAAEEDGVVAPGEPVSNDHYERDRVKKTRELGLRPNVSVTAAWPASFLMKYTSREAFAECDAANGDAYCTQVPLSLATFVAATKQLNDLYGIPAWVTIRDRLVVRIDEQYFP
jgi:hypothetical protein